MTAAGEGGPDATGHAPGEVLLVGVDGSPTSDRALEEAFALAPGLGASVCAVLVVKLVAPTGEQIGATAALEEAADEVAESMREVLQARSAHTGVRAELVVRRGSVLTELVRTADERPVRMVLVGASTSPGHRLIGALAPRIVRVGRWSVTVVP